MMAGQKGKHMGSRKWYAVVIDAQDDDMGTGAWDLDMAMQMVRELKAEGYENAYIKVIDDDRCIQEIH